MYIVQDQANPGNEGRVMLFKFGSKIMDIISSALNPKFQDEQSLNAFDPWTGANFKLKIVKKDNQTNYDKSSFDAPSKLGSDAEIEKIYEKIIDISEFVDPKNFKSYDALQEAFHKVENGPARTSARSGDDNDDDDAEDSGAHPAPENPLPSRGHKATPTTPKPKAAEKVAEKVSADLESEEDVMDFFKTLAD